MSGRAPLPLLLIGLGGLICLAGSEHPFIVGAGALGALALLIAAPRRPPALALWSAGIVAGGLFILTPWISSDGRTELLSGPPLAVIDTAVTAEELLWGATLAVRLAGVILLILAVLAWIDQDRAQDLLGRFLPRSALMIGLAGRMLPALESDAALVAQSARLRGVDLDGGGRLARARAAAPLVLPVTATALERGVDSAEALAARGFGSGVATRLPEEPLHLGERMAGACGGLLTAIGILVAVGLIGAFDFFPRPGGATGAATLGAGTLILAALVVAGLSLRRGTR